jgi:signal transduction histidine kinase
VIKPDPVRILLVDDNPDDRRWIARWLAEDQAFECVVDEADCVSEAARLLESRAFDLGVVDWELPDGAGIELARHPSVLAQRLPLIFVTGSERPDQGSFAVAHGAADFLPKDDVTPRALSRACAHALMRSRLEREIDVLRAAEIAAGGRERDARILAELSLSEERKARARVTALHALSSMLSAATTVDEIAAVVIQHLPAFERAHALSIYLVRDAGLALRGATGAEPDARATALATPLTTLTPLTEAVRRGSLVCVHDDAALRARLPLLAATLNCSWLAMPLMSQGQALGVLEIRFESGVMPAADGLAYIELVAQNIAQALHRAHLYDEAQLATVFEQRLLAVVGHDLRTPLWAITMVAQALKSRETNSKLIVQLERSAKRMADLISDVLDRATVRHGLPSARAVESRALESVLGDQLDELRTALPDAEIRLEIVQPIAAQCDASRLAQVVANLVRNAVQHGQARSPILVRLSEHATAAVLTVHNRGAPIPREELPDLFDPFKRGRRAGGAGTGLGLFIVRDIVSALGGTVDVCSDQHGTVFTVVLPNTPRMARASFAHPEPT